MKFISALFALIGLLSTAAQANPASPIPVFHSNQILGVEIVADLHKINNKSKKLKTEGVIRFTDRGQAHEFDLLLNTRGNYKRELCSFDPLDFTILPSLPAFEQELQGTPFVINPRAASDIATLRKLRAKAAERGADKDLRKAFKRAVKTTLQGTLLEGSNHELKYATHCWFATNAKQQAIYDERVIREHAVYSVIDATQVLPGLKVRLVDAVYKGTNGKLITSGKGMLLEERDDMLKRFGYDDALSSDEAAKTEVATAQAKIPFYFTKQLAADDDFKIMGHNGFVLRKNGVPSLMVAYDFDLAGLVRRGGPLEWKPGRNDDRLWFDHLMKKDPRYWASRDGVKKVGGRVNAIGPNEHKVDLAAWQSDLLTMARSLVTYKRETLDAVSRTYGDKHSKLKLGQRLEQYFSALEAELAERNR